MTQTCWQLSSGGWSWAIPISVFMRPPAGDLIILWRISSVCCISKNHGAVGYLVDGTGMVLVLQNEAVHFRKELEGTMSLFALTKEAKGVNIRGMKYSLENAVITNDFPIGISNEFLGEEAEVSVEDGELVCMIRYYEDEV